MKHKFRFCFFTFNVLYSISKYFFLFHYYYICALYNCLINYLFFFSYAYAAAAQVFFHLYTVSNFLKIFKTSFLYFDWAESPANFFTLIIYISI